ncbi:MAG: archaeosortase/exosortase family protein, partial [Halioglobus sp.]|nr:archaeosortase/exosortase family protein [Halioglobus sp.]
MPVSGGLGRVTARAGLWMVAFYSLALVAVYYETAWSMVAIWARSETFAHGFLIMPISLWLIWSRRGELDQCIPAPNWKIAFFLLPISLTWLMAWLVDVAVVKQLALVAMLVAGCWAILGRAMASVLAFPLLFLF